MPVDTELWIHFIHPTTHDILQTLPLGAELIGERTFDNDLLRFNPAREQWVMGVVLVDTRAEEEGDV